MGYIWDNHMQRRLYLPGSVLTVPGDFPLVTHFFMVDFDGYGTWNELGIQSVPETGVALAFLALIARNKRVTEVFRPQTPDIAYLVVARMRSKLGVRYDLRSANCEHVVRWAVTGRWESLQVDNLRRALG
jgi:hypothetical protein